jgi:hypothetical protein
VEHSEVPAFATDALRDTRQAPHDLGPVRKQAYRRLEVMGPEPPEIPPEIDPKRR